MIDRLITFAVEQRLLIVLLMVGLVGWGIYSIREVPIDAFPDVTNNQVQIMTKASGMSPIEVEKLVTYPVEVAMASLPDVIENRSLSQFGLTADEGGGLAGQIVWECRRGGEWGQNCIRTPTSLHPYSSTRFTWPIGL